MLWTYWQRTVTTYRALQTNQQTGDKPMTTEQIKSLPLSGIANLIRRDWKKPYFGAVPYIDAMAQLNSVDDDYWNDSGKSIILYFLSNASSWRGDVAKLVKTELKRRIK